MAAKQGAGTPMRFTLLNRRNLLVCAALIVLGLGTAHVVHSSTARVKYHRSQLRCHAVHIHGKRHAGKCATRMSVSRRKHAAAKRAHRAVIARKSDSIRSYARALLPGLSVTRSLFDRASADAGGSSADALDGVCGSYGNQMSIVETQLDGVPHAGQWYGAVAGLHRSLLGLFHDMLGAMSNCQTGAANGDYYAISVAQNDAVAADEGMRAFDDRAVWLAHHG